jgi:hypothetical protein
MRPLGSAAGCTASVDDGTLPSDDVGCASAGDASVDDTSIEAVKANLM